MRCVPYNNQRLTYIIQYGMHIYSMIIQYMYSSLNKWYMLYYEVQLTWILIVIMQTYFQLILER